VRRDGVGWKGRELVRIGIEIEIKVLSQRIYDNVWCGRGK